ncbi:MAG: hypothetical protein DIZ80_09070 [endosymbiont of Galathealinum brachiosum]|uniref:DUF2244 domain-containing protein n=1 Tax=endosymbiont of Galathealinum brachiosum TaxID=2200906 RepID=A0A370DC28_9GAMM|nr:MAG: hypothetical protein DIZ80_09070 [endosymbiont of Galathealinum brachiosum]
MITPVLNIDGFTGHILIEPNRPISWQDNVRFIKAFSLISLIIASVAMYQGFILVMPFSGIEVIFVSVCLYLVYKHYSICQIIYFTNNSIIIESGDNIANQRIEYQRYWSKFHVDNKGIYNIPKLSISSKGKTTEIGSFLSYKDKLTLIKIIKEITLSFQIQVQ